MTTFVNNDVASGNKIYASDHNTQGALLASVINGNIDDTNISGVSGTKILSGTLPSSAFASDVDWRALGTTLTSVTNNGNGSYSGVFSGVDFTNRLQPGTRLRTTRTVAAPTQSTLLNGTSQYWVKTSPNKLTFTDDFVVSAWVKMSSYATGVVVSRFNGTSGWGMAVESTGQVSLTGYNASAANFSQLKTYQSIPLNRWVHITAQLDMSAFTATTTTSYVMIDGTDVPAFVARAGTNPTSLIQAGNLEIGSQNGGTSFFPGKIAQVAIFNAKVTQSTMQGYLSRGLIGTETSLASAYSFNGVATDLNTTTPNDLTASGSAGYTTDSPFGTQGNGTISSTLDYAIVTRTLYSGGNTTLTVQVPEGCTIPTTGGVSSVAYSTVKVPYGFPSARYLWRVVMLYRSSTNPTQSSAVVGTWYNPLGLRIALPVGSWTTDFIGATRGVTVSTSTADVQVSLSTSASAETITEFTTSSQALLNSSGTQITKAPFHTYNDLNPTTQTSYYLITKTSSASQSTTGYNTDTGESLQVVSTLGYI